MTNVSSAVADKDGTTIRRESGELAARTILAKLTSPDFTDACHVALELGHLNAVSLLPYLSSPTYSSGTANIYAPRTDQTIQRCH